jgi:hypothetical protein
VRIAQFILFVGALAYGTALLAEPGDLGRPRETSFLEEHFPWLNRWLEGPGLQTDDERRLCDLAYAVLLPPEVESPTRFTHGNADLIAWWNEWIAAHPFDVQNYAKYLINKPYRSSTSRYARLIDDIRADIGRVPLFFSMANRVLEADAVRSRSFQFVSRFPPEHAELARERIAENRLLMDQVYERFRERIASYHYALESLLVLSPSPNAIEAERALAVLEDRLKRITAPAPEPVVAGGAVIRK